MTSPSPQRHDLLSRLFAPVDIRFLVFFRIHFGAMMLWALWEFHEKNLIASLYAEPTFHFTYYGFSWLQPWPGSGMYWHFAGLAVMAAFVMIGFLYRISALLLSLGFSYVFLLEKAVYLNHYYVVCLLCFVLSALPAHRAWSIDAYLWPKSRSDVVPAWTLWLLRFQIALPYVFGGIAKLNGDWLQGQPMQLWLSTSVWRVLLGPVAAEPWFALAFSWSGLVLDLAIVPLLLWRRTQFAAFGVIVLFHLMNAFMFDIGIFPWLMIGATTVFFEPDWPRRLLDQPLPSPTMRNANGGVRPAQKLVAALLGIYVIIHLALPFRHHLYPGNSLWTEEGAHFAWRMMLRDKKNALRLIVTEAESGKALQPDLSRWLSPQQIESMGHDPEMMREFANHLRIQHARDGAEIEVRFLALCSLNGRKPQLLVDPTVDLSRQPRTLGHQRYIVPLREPFRRVPWSVPVAEWEAR